MGWGAMGECMGGERTGAGRWVMGRVGIGRELWWWGEEGCLREWFWSRCLLEGVTVLGWGVMDECMGGERTGTGRLGMGR